MVKKEFLDKAIFLTAGIFVLLLPLDVNILAPLIGLMIVLAAIGSGRSVIANNLQTFKSTFIFFVLLFVWQLISVAWSTDMANGLKAIEHRMFYLAAPLLFLLVKRWPSKKLMKLFVIGNFLISVYCFINLVFFFINEKFYFIDRTINEGITQETFHYLAYHSGANFIAFDVHRLYFSFSLLTGLLFLYFNKGIIKNIFLKYLIAFTFIFVIFLLLSKIAIILLVLLLVYITFQKFKQGKTKKRMVLISVFVLILSLGFYLARTRFHVFIEQMGMITENKEGSLIERFQYTKCSLELIGEAPLFGYGIGDVNHVMKEKLNKYNYTFLLERGVYDPHNEFLKIFIGSGVVGFILFLGIFSSIFRKAYNDRNFLLLIYTGFVFIVCLIEPFLSRQAGILPTLFFIGLLTNKEENPLSL